MYFNQVQSKILGVTIMPKKSFSYMTHSFGAKFWTPFCCIMWLKDDMEDQGCALCCSSTHEIASFLEWLTYFEHVALCFYRHVYFWHPLLDAHPTTCHSNIDIRLRPITELGKSTLVHHYFRLVDILFHFVFSIWHGPPLFHLHGKELRK
jgi:hypothetical protein